MNNAPCSTNSQQETIAAVATAPGRGGVGIIRISGPGCLAIALSVCKIKPKPRYAHYGDFVDEQGQVLDQGLSLYFPGPHSFTGEDVLELQAHGGPVILDLLLKRVCQLGARLARPGEFSERAYLNDKIDLAQAEAIADLIQASSEHAAKQALNSLKGVFSQKITQLVESLIQLRIYVESAIDFPEEEIDFLGDGKILGDLETLVVQTQDVLEQAQQGAIVREGMKVAILGKPNAGKSSLLNALAAKEVAIVTDIAGTTRDVLREHIHLDGMPLHIIDTAGIRHSEDKVEQIGIERAWLAAEEADAIILLLDAQSADSPQNQWPQLFEQASLHKKLLVVVNKIDLLHKESDTPSKDAIAISVKTGSGLQQLKQALKQQIGYRSTTEGAFSARRRHVEALEQALSHLLQGKVQLQEFAAGELLAEELSIAQTHLSEITGDFSSDDLLGRIFSSFCIGK